jgi:hypothetical protein
MKRPIIPVVLALVACAASASIAIPISAETTSTVGVGPLTSETYEDAIACGRLGADCAVTPYLLCPSLDGRFSSYIATPFARVASSIFEASKSREPMKPMSLGEANGWGVGIYVAPGANQRLADSIQKVIIQRGKNVIEPITTTIAPAVYRGSSNPPLTKGFFAFPMHAFAPTSSTTMLLIGAHGTTSCSLDRTKLEALR